VPDKIVECGAGWSFDTPSATDNCGSASIALVSTVTNTACGNTFVAVRTWQATDACGNTAYCSQTVTVLDTTPPTLTCARNKTVPSGTPWSFDLPTASDACRGTNVIVEVISTVTNGSPPCAFTATRTWQAADLCGNEARCSQTVTVVDQTPPAVSCPTNLVAGTDPGQCTAVVAYVAFAFDICGLTNFACAPPSGSTFPIGVTTVNCTASDASGNTAACSFTVTIRDAEPPHLVCLSDISHLLADADPGQCSKSNVTFAVITGDNCSSATVACNPPSGSTFPIGLTTVR
jgi:hypothetical protein